MRIAWFSPLPPVHSGIAAYSVDVLDDVRRGHQVHLYVDDRVWGAAGGGLHAGLGPLILPLAGPHGLPLYRAYDFVVRHEQAPYDLIVYQLGNAACHRFMWPYLLRWPGLVVLHDGALHHARAQALLADRRPADYRAEFRFNHPGVDPRVADYVVAGLQGSPYYLWPMLRTVMTRARGVAVHSGPLREALAETYPATPVTTFAMGVPDPWDAPGARDRVPGTGYRVPDPAIVADAGVSTAETASPVITLSAFGLITPEKRILSILRALAALRDDLPPVQLRLVGEIGEHYALWEDVRRTGTRDLIEVTGYVDDTALAAELRDADICLCLRWPTAHETSASWLRCLAAGKPTVIADQLSTVDVPTVDPRHWQLKHVRTDAAAVLQPPGPSHAVAVSVDIADEEAMVRQALRRLITDADLRAALGTRAREWWEAHHTLPRMHREYEQALRWASALPDPVWAEDTPAHLRSDPAAWARELTDAFGVEVDLLRPR